MRAPLVLQHRKKVAASWLSSLLQRQGTINSVAPLMEMDIAIMNRLGSAGVGSVSGGALVYEQKAHK